LAVTDEAIEKVKAMITSGPLRAADRLPREADLAADLGLSRSSLREAVRALSLVNILDVRRGDGTYVTAARRSGCRLHERAVHPSPGPRLLRW